MVDDHIVPEMLTQVFFSVHFSVWSSLKIILHALISFQCLRERNEDESGATVSLFSLLVASSPLPPSLSQHSNIRL